MRIDPGDRVVFSPQDISRFERCPWAVARQYHSVRHGSWPLLPPEQSLRELMNRTLAIHRQRVVGMWEHESSEIIHCDPHAPESDVTAWQASSATIVNPRVLGTDPHSGLLIDARVDALVAQSPGLYRIEQARLGRSAKRRLVIELAGAGAALGTAGIDISPVARVIPADCQPVDIDLDEAGEVWAQSARGLAAMTREIDLESVDLEWASTRLDQCGRESCPWCQAELKHNDDLFHIARLRRSHRRILRASGFLSLTRFAEASFAEVAQAVTHIDTDVLRRSHLQATLQLLASHSLDSRPPVEVIDHNRLEAIPKEASGDIFLDFEGDPAYQEWPEGSACDPGAKGPTSWLGIDYLIGVVEAQSGEYQWWWADDFEEERQAWRGFIDWLDGRLARHPQLRIYHYASYEHTALLRLAARHSYGVALVETLITNGHLVDLYLEVMASLVVGTEGYSLKDLEALYFDSSERAGIASGGDSVLAFENYREATEPTRTALRQSIVDYNSVDCRSTRGLHTWLGSLQ